MSWLHNMKISTKLVSSFIIITVLLAVVGLLGLQNLKTISDDMDDMYSNRLVSVQVLSKATMDYQRIRVGIRDILILSGEQRQERISEIEGMKKGVEESVNVFRGTPLTDKDYELLSKFDMEWEAYLQLVDDAFVLANENKDDELLNLLTGDMKKAGDALKTTLDEIIDLNVGFAEQSNMDAKDAYDSSRMITIGIIVVAVAVSLLLAFGISRMITKSINKLMHIVAEIAAGDLRQDVDIKAKDEVGQLAASVNEMLENLRDLIGKTLQSAQSVAAASQQISASTEEIASGSADQSSAAQRMNELFRDLSEAVNSVAQSAEQASELSNQTVSVARQGGTIVQSSMESMETVNIQMKRLEDDSTKIGEIIEVIDEIAEQTNLLALNAAIEAARAGEQGRGFAVVADEVRKLAERSGEATKQITSIIKGMQSNTGVSVQSVSEAVQKTKQVHDSFAEIIDMVNQTATNVNEIAAASEEQSAQVNDFVHSIESIASTSEEAAAASEETASSSQSLAKLSEELNEVVSVFKI
ncbi:methyl-accepting chemotaxis protein [Marinicrinis lubricantis]|uniref:Methyl-accepting chemotaxis protein n=1 Tax=Marinicrinis lubricantis TaxID=2086470 RepID=A0ABW1IPH8_9BACL